MRLPVSHAPALAALFLFGGCGVAAGSVMAAAAPSPANEPAGDHPVALGDPFVVDGTTYTPGDQLKYDRVGYASIAGSGAGVSGAHKTLPLPSYVEVTALASGKTILVRLDRRGPMSNDYLVELSPDAAMQLGVAGAVNVPVRMRRVNPPEPERARLRAGNRAPERLATPRPLLDVLAHKLAANEPLKTAAPGEAAAAPPPAMEADRPGQQPAPAARAADTPGLLVVQVAAFSAEERARSTADKLGGAVSKPGRYWLTRLGPFAAHTDAEAALAKARAAGYSDARIQRAD